MRRWIARVHRETLWCHGREYRGQGPAATTCCDMRGRLEQWPLLIPEGAGADRRRRAEAWRREWRNAERAFVRTRTRRVRAPIITRLRPWAICRECSGCREDWCRRVL